MKGPVLFQEWIILATLFFLFPLAAFSPKATPVTQNSTTVQKTNLRENPSFLAVKN